MTFNNKQIFSFYYPNSLKVNFPNVLEGIANYFDNNASKSIKYNDLLHTLNLYQIPEKEHSVVDAWAADKISVWETLFQNIQNRYAKYYIITKN